jgi:hypothetical protein
MPELEEKYNEWKEQEGKIIHILIGDVDGPFADMDYFTVNFVLLEGPDPEKVESFDVDVK